MRIIELVGLPGCGKSTIINLAINNSHFEGVILREDLFRTNLPCVWSMKYLLSVNMTIKAFRSFNLSDKKYFDRLNYLVQYLTYYLETAPDSFLLLEEGLVQYFSSLAFDCDLDEKLRPLISHLLNKFNPIIVDCVIPVDIASERIIQRNKDRDRYNIDDSDIRIKLLKQKRKNIEYVLSIYNNPDYTLNMINSKYELGKELQMIIRHNYE